MQASPQAAGRVQATQRWVAVLQYSPVAAQSPFPLHPQWLGRPRMQALSVEGPQMSLQVKQFSVVPKLVSQPSAVPPPQAPPPKSQAPLWHVPDTPLQLPLAWA